LLRFDVKFNVQKKEEEEYHRNGLSD